MSHDTTNVAMTSVGAAGVTAVATTAMTTTAAVATTAVTPAAPAAALLWFQLSVKLVFVLEVNLTTEATVYMLYTSQAELITWQWPVPCYHPLMHTLHKCVKIMLIRPRR